MKLKLLTTLIGLSQIITVSVLTFEKQTSLSHNWRTNRPAIEAKIRANHTVQKGAQAPSFDQSAYDNNVIAVEEYSEAFLCASKIDVTKCRPAANY